MKLRRGKGSVGVVDETRLPEAFRHLVFGDWNLSWLKRPLLELPRQVVQDASSAS